MEMKYTFYACATLRLFPYSACLSEYGNTSEAEAELTEYVKKMEILFYGLSVTDMRRAAYKLAKSRGQAPAEREERKMATRKWYRGFRQRHPELVLRKAEATSIARVTGMNHPAVDKFYNLENILHSTGVSGDRIFNVDECGVTPVHKPGRILCEEGRKQV